MSEINNVNSCAVLSPMVTRLKGINVISYYDTYDPCETPVVYFDDGEYSRIKILLRERDTVIDESETEVLDKLANDNDGEYADKMTKALNFVQMYKEEFIRQQKAEITSQQLITIVANR